jgi:MFS transporter, PAT family, beta-lactamase induction signal transducer AmpG
MSAAKPSTRQSLKLAFTSWRLGAVTLMSFSSGLPLGLVWTAVPAWLAMAGVDIKTIGILTLVQAPYSFKFLWSPLIDRFRPPAFGHKRGWAFITQLLLAVLIGLLAWQAVSPEIGTVAALMLLIAFASASQDIAVDAYTVESLRPEEQGLAVGARVALYRVGMWLAGNIAISVSPALGWRTTLLLLSAIYVLLLPVTVFAPEPETQQAPAKSLREAAWEPFVGFFQRGRALEITAFLLLYKLADNLAGALVRPFLVQVGFDPLDVGIATGTIGLFATILGTFLGGVLTNNLGVGRALWYFGFLQAISNVGYAIVAQVGVSRPLLYSAMLVEAGTQGLGTAAFGVLMLRLTEKRFSATQYALFSSIFSLGRILAGPVSGAMVDAIGWRDYFVLTIISAIPGMLMLQRFVPWGARDIPPQSDAPVAAGTGAAVTQLGLALRGLAGFAAGTALALATNASLAALKNARGGKPFDILPRLMQTLQPTVVADYLELTAVVVFGLMTGLAVAAYVAARHGVAGPARQASAGGTTPQ